MHRFTDPYTTFYTTTSQSPVHQGFSHYFSITQTTYISRPTITFVQHSTSPQSFHRYTYALNNPLRYKDPSGEFFVIDDLVFGIVGGAFNVVSNINNIQNIWQGAGYFAVGFASGALAQYITPVGASALLGAGNAALGSYFSTKSIDVGGVIQGAVMGGIVGGITYGLGSSLSTPVNKVLNGISSPVLRQTVAGAGIGMVVGGIGGGIGALMTGGNIGRSVLNGALSGMVYGTISGSYIGYRFAQQTGVNPWTGERLTESTTNEPNTSSISKAELVKKQIRANVQGDYDKALQEWNNIRRQYGLEPENIPPYQNSGFNIKLPDGSNVNGQFYYGGITNPNGYTIKINYSPPNYK
ncbi:MAG: hypothetical protein AB1304_05790 [Bacteroidota bacterium]